MNKNLMKHMISMTLVKPFAGCMGFCLSWAFDTYHGIKFYSENLDASREDYRKVHDEAEHKMAECLESLFDVIIPTKKEG